MPIVTFSGTYYNDTRHRFTRPGDYDVDDAKAKQLLADFPDQFAVAEGTQNDSGATDSTPNLSKMNRAQLEAVASDMGVEVTKEHDTNKKLQEAIQHAYEDRQRAGNIGSPEPVSNDIKQSSE